MFNLSEISQKRLSTCHIDLIILAHKSIPDSPYDFMITHGHRSPQLQFSLYKKGREFIDGKWLVVDRSKVVTNLDGIVKKSKHNKIPAEAFDIAILIDGKITWAVDYYKSVSDHILTRAYELTQQGVIQSRIRWGGIFSNYDGPHFEIY